MHPHHHGCEEPTRVEGEDILNALFPEGIVPDGGVMPPPMMECQHGMPPKPCPPKPPMMHDMYRTILTKLMRLVYNMQGGIQNIENNVTNIENKIEGGEFNITVDDAMSATSTNPVQNKVIHAAIQQLKVALEGITDEVGNCKCVVDSALSSTSVNPVQNKAIAAKLRELNDRIDSIGPITGGGGSDCNCVVDSELSPTSNNPVRNLAIYAAIKNLENMKNINTGGGGGNDNPGGGTGGGTDVPPPAPEVEWRLVTVYKASSTKPAKPVGGGYDFVLEKPVTPQDNWTLNVPQSGKVWVSYNTFRSNSTDSGWTDPVEYIDFNGILDKIGNELDKLYEQLLENARKDLDDALEEAKENAEQAKRDIENARQMLEDARDLLASLDENQGDAGIKLEEALAKIKIFSDWYDVNAGTVTNLSEELDAVKGTITQHGTHIDTLNNTINTAQRQLDAVNATITDECVRVNAETGEVTRVSNLIDALKGKIESNGRYYDETTGRSTTVRETLDALEGKITNQVATVYADKESVNLVKTELDAAKNAWTVEAARLDDKITSVGTITVDPDSIVAALAKDLGEDKKVGAALVLAINAANESEAIIDADHIYLNGDVLARALKAGDLTIYNQNNLPVIHLAGDGSGFVAGGKLQWGVNGTVSLGNWTVNENTITGGNLVLDSVGKIYCKSGNNTYWSLNNDGSATFGSGRFKIYNNGTIAQNEKSDGTASMKCDSNGTGSIAYGNISWDADGDLSIKGGNTTTRWKLGFDGLTYQNDELGLRKTHAYIGLHGVTVSNKFTNEMININAGSIFIKDSDGNKHIGATRTFTVNGQTMKFVKGVLVANDAPIVFPPEPSDI